MGKKVVLPSTGFLVATVAAALSAGFPISARAQIPTTDGSVIPQIAQTAQTLSQQLAQVQAFQSQIQGTLRTLGGLGSLPQQVLGQLMRQLNPMSLLNIWAETDRSCALDACGDFLKDRTFIPRPGVPSLPTTPDFSAQREYVDTRFFSPSDLDSQGRQQVLDERARAARAAARDGYAVALAARERVAQAPRDAQRVIQVGSSGGTMREDIQRLSAVLMAIYQERQHQLALYAALLEVEATAALVADANVVSPRGRNQGQNQRISGQPQESGMSPSSSTTGTVPQIHLPSVPFGTSASERSAPAFPALSTYTLDPALAPIAPPAQASGAGGFFSGGGVQGTPIPGRLSEPSTDNKMERP